MRSGSADVRALEAEAPQADADLGAAHEELPQEAGAVVLDHDDDRALIDGEMRLRIPILALAEGIDEAVIAPKMFAELPVEMLEGSERVFGHIGDRRKRSGRRDHAEILVRRIGLVAARPVARGQAPGIRAIAFEVVRIADAVLAIDQHMAQILLPVISVAILEAVRIEPEEGIMREEERSAIVEAKRKLDPIVIAAILEVLPFDPALVIDAGID